jgi:alpha-L-arabinofuranosidase
MMNALIIDADLGTDQISRHIYGHFAEHLGRCIYGGFWVGEDSPIPNLRGIRQDVVQALRAMEIPNLRWPGGCFADEYHWMDGIGPRQNRPAMVNTHWGGVTESNHFGTHEFMDLCEQLECEPYICGNLGSGTVREMQQWVEYLTAPAGPMADLRRANGRPEPWSVRMWGVGNENWGCGGSMRPEYYADEYRRYATYCRNLGANQLYKAACGPSGADYRWTEVLMREAGQQMQALAPHYYCGSGKNSRSATEFGEEDWFDQLRRALQMDELVTRHGAIMDQYDPEGRVGMLVDEWGAWHAVEPGTNPGFLHQQNSVRDALVAGVTLNLFNQHCSRVHGANIAQTVNVLQAMVLTEQDGQRMVLTPTYHVFEMYKEHQGATLVPAALTCAEYSLGEDAIPALSASASRGADDSLLVTVCNLHPQQDHELSCEIRGMAPVEASGRVLTAPTMTAHNTFDLPDTVVPEALPVTAPDSGRMTLRIPARSVVALHLS